MSQKQTPLLGPDGKPLDVEKYRPKPEPVVLLDGKPINVGEVHFEFKTAYDPASWIGRYFTYGHEDSAIKSRKPTQRQKVRQGMTLAAAARRDIAALHKAAPAEWKGHTEVELVPPELTDTYAVAFASARKNCEHKNSHSTLHARRERQCEDCGRYFTRKEWYEG